MTDKSRKTVDAAFTYPRYDELPDELMFVGGIVDYVNLVHAALPPRVRRDKVFTTAMATNYVKSRLTPPAIGRRYNRDHLSLILFAATAKLCFSAEEVHWLAEKLFNPDDMRASHDQVAIAFNEAFVGGEPAGRAGAVALSLVARVSALS